MEERKTVFEHISRMFSIYGIMMLVMSVLCYFFGDGAKEISSMFGLGSQGLPLATMLQYLGIAVMIEGFRTLFFTERFIKRMSVVLRTACLLLAIIFLIVLFVVWFDWFPAGSWEAWGMFFLCFGASFGVSLLLTIWKERVENQRMADGLERLKKQWQVKESASKEKVLKEREEDGR